MENLMLYPGPDSDKSNNLTNLTLHKIGFKSVNNISRNPADKHIHRQIGACHITSGTSVS